MAKMIDALRIRLCLKRIETLQARKTFLENLLALQLNRIDMAKAKQERQCRQQTDISLAHTAIAAGEANGYVTAEHDRRLEQLKQRYRLRYRALRETYKRKLAKVLSERQAEIKEQRERAFQALERRKSTALAALEARFAPDADHLELRKTAYAELKAKAETDLALRLQGITARSDRAREKVSAHMVKKIEGIERSLLAREQATAALKDKLPKSDYGIPEDVLLRIENLTMRFGGLVAVDDLSFDVKQGEIFGLIGPNGAGKTTVFNCITKFYRPAAGRMYFRKNPVEVIRLNDYPVHNIIRQGIVRTFQNVELVWELPVIDNLLVAAHTLFRTGFFGQLIHTRKLKQEEAVLRKKATDILAMLGLLPYAHMIPFGLPYGILKKIELARTLMVDPRMIILDEPAAGLNDAETRDLARIIRTIRDQNQTTIFLVEHDMGLVMDVCDTICAISFGKKLALGTPREIQADKAVRDAYLGEE